MNHAEVPLASLPTTDSEAEAPGKRSVSFSEDKDVEVKERLGTGLKRTASPSEATSSEWTFWWSSATSRIGDTFYQLISCFFQRVDDLACLYTTLHKVCHHMDEHNLEDAHIDSAVQGDVVVDYHEQNIRCGRCLRQPGFPGVR